MTTPPQSEPGVGTPAAVRTPRTFRAARRMVTMHGLGALVMAGGLLPDAVLHSDLAGRAFSITVTAVYAAFAWRAATRTVRVTASDLVSRELLRSRTIPLAEVADIAVGSSPLHARVAVLTTTGGASLPLPALTAARSGPGSRSSAAWLADRVTLLGAAIRTPRANAKE